MCAINGITKRDIDLVNRMNKTTKHRGPDGSDIISLDQVTLGHNRLAIIDISRNASQPMWSYDKSLVLVYNGEIYNFQSLKKELNDYKYSSSSDSEVILAAYKRWGVDCVKKFNGIFAFALWDLQKNILFMARDPFGIKPLYYSIQEGDLVFSSDIKAILEAKSERKLNIEAFQHYLYLNHSPSGEQLVEGVYEFPIAHYAVFRNSKLDFSQYWNSDFSTVGSDTQQGYIEKVRYKIDQAVERQLVSDRPVGLLLSGGIDSSTILATATRLKGQVETYTTSFDIETSNEDARIAAKTAVYFGSTHNDIRISDNEVIDLVQEAIWYLDLPINSSTVVSQLAVAKKINKSVSVLLGGDGGDELFGGYTRYKLALAANYYQKLPQFTRRFLSKYPRFRKLNQLSGLEQFKLFYTHSDDLVQNLSTVPIKDNIVDKFYQSEFGYLADTNAMTRMLEIDRRLLHFGSLLRTDKMFMAGGIEARVPLLDLELARLADSIPVKYKTSLFNTKIILKEAVKDRLPNYLFRVKKRGWVSPVSTWMRNSQFKSFMKDVLSPNYHLGTKDLLNWEQVGKMLLEHENGDSSKRFMLWSILTFQIWARTFDVKL